MNGNTEAGSVIMCTDPYRTAYWARRPAVMLPDTSADVIAGLCRHYGVRYLVMPPSEATRLRAFGGSGPETGRFISLANVAGYEIFTYIVSPPHADTPE